MKLSSFIDQHTLKIEPLETANRLAWWNLATSGEPKYAKEFEETKIAIRNIYASKADYQLLQSLEPSLDPLLNRQKDLILYQYLENQIPENLIKKMAELETEIESSYTNFRPKIRERELSNNDLKQILRDSSNSQERKEAWEASKLIGVEVEKKVLTLIAIRNEAAREAGFSDYYSMRLELQELDQKRLFEILEKLEELTDPTWKSYKAELDQSLAHQYRILPSELKPWHYHDPFFQEAPSQDFNLDIFYSNKDLVEIARTFYEKVGLSADDVLLRSDLYEREKKSQHAFCICMDHHQDVRMLCNLRDNAFWMSTLLHEMGHAVYDKYIDPHLPYFLREPAHISTTEAIAMLFGRLSNNEDFLNHDVGIDKLQMVSLGNSLRHQGASNLLVFARWTLVMIHFERAMYQQPHIDLNCFWWECVARFQGVTPDESRHQPDWAAKLHLACAPVYYQNYILGEMIASQLIHYIQKHLPSQEALGDFLKTRLFSLGAKLPWEQALQHATGENLNPQYFANDVQGMEGFNKIPSIERPGPNPTPADHLGLPPFNS